MGDIYQIVSGVLVLIGAFFILVGGIGLVRMPDIFTRMHAAGIKDTMGAGFLLAGMAVYSGFTIVSLKLGVLFLLFLFTSPVVSHALAQAALHDKVKPVLGDQSSDDKAG
ncbi:MAG: monovalent cation/H(+) antiporter subunit G [Methyloligellaceae bacterium]